MKENIKLNIILTYVIAIIIASLIFYFMIPSLLNYGEGTINTNFDKEFSGGICYYQQVLIAVCSLLFIVCLTLAIILRNINKYKTFKEEYKKTNDPKIKKQIDFIKTICLRLPNTLLSVFVVVPLFLSIIVLFIQSSYLTSSDFKLVLFILILSVTTISIANTNVRKILSKILIELENTDFCNVRRTGLVKRLLFQILPIMSVGIMFTYLAISSVYERNNSSILENYYTNQFKSLSSKSISSPNELISSLFEINRYSDDNIFFVADNNFNYIYESGDLSDFFKAYAAQLSQKNNNKIYDYYGTSGQGTLYPIMINGSQYYVGVYYLIYNSNTVTYIMIILLSLMFVCSIIIYTFAKELSNNVKEVSKSLGNINNNNSFTEKKLYITSVDEIGDLTIEYNKVQSLTVKNINEIHNNQQMLMERERLASLGQLIGGIAHNLKTPIMSISGAAEGITDLIKEYNSSIDDPQVNSQDHHAIAHDMTEWVEKIRDYTSYMSDIITAVKGQAVTLSHENDISFTLEELLKRVDILMKHELKNALIYLKISLDVDESTILNGDINSLVQVINNMISNAIQAYNGKTEQNIYLTVKKDNNNIIISIKDEAGGLPKEVQEKLFKEMITTKGKNGTGLGLYISYSTIRGHFNGDITFDVEDGKSTTFNIILPE